MMTARSFFAVRLNPPESASNFRVLIWERSFAMTYPPGLLTAPSMYAIPACGTVTISPAWRIMLFVAFPDSTSSLRLMVIVLLRGGGSLSAGGLATVSAELFDAERTLDRDSVGAVPFSADSFGVVAEAKSSGPRDGG